MTGAFAELPPEIAELVRHVLEKRNPDLVISLRACADVGQEEREGVERALADELMTQISAPSWEPTPYGLRLEGAIDSFLRRFPFRRGVSDGE